MTPRVSWLDRTAETVRTLLADMAADPNGQYEPCVYETGRLVTLAPSLPGHRQRVRFLLAEQHDDGRWGGPDEYDLVTTLSATEALLTERRRPGATPAVARAADLGVEALSRRLARPGSLPDTVAVELVVPALLSDVNAHLARLGRAPLPEPAGTRPDLVEAVRDALAEGHALPEKLWHSLELFGPSATAAASVRPERTAGGGHLVGCSPAATAAWLGDDVLADERHPGVAYLLAVQHENGGVPVAAPLSLFERSWVLSTLLDTGVPLTAPRPVLEELRRSLHAAFGDEGAAGGLGLPVDVDDTAAGLHALALLGSPRSPDCLRRFDRGDHFFCFPEERTPSTSANAHVVQALGALLALPRNSLVLDDESRAWCADALATVVRWLKENQHADGSWTDKWHASPYYATVCCAVALARHGGSAAREAVDRAVEWVLATERDGGAWGRWSVTREETAYAVRVLLVAGERSAGRGADQVATAAARGARYLLSRWSDERPHPPLWHDKDVYTPTRIIRTEILAALYAAHTDPRTAPLLADADLPVVVTGSGAA
ncbi:prenyltransferase/squalene oxidase repeat-containing protein [Saccharomonospora xinjiangensis]|uniref:prenyltransferase/squalene oxidase repeat-containing protein n=1 Tax=Saccharomonospora xinjiangensis TaxID=75294 RepID=UPI0010704CDC|nr:prenyltransferase/squalene oxidase repeat-containing protein [Saccharomonospora xinjiangensis]QBQ59283.1 Terpentedienyl-diphosphate synthase [Saccharomonospora xinjiangensis]